MAIKIRQIFTTLGMIIVLLSVTTLSAFAGSWHASTAYWSTVGDACLDGVEIVARLHDGNEEYLPLSTNWEVYTWFDDSPGGPIVTDEPTWIYENEPIYQSDQLGRLLGRVRVMIENQELPLLYEYAPGDWQKTFNWGSESLVWDDPGAPDLSIGSSIYVRHPSESAGFLVALQDCAL